jgi:hypothetical protein
MTRLNVNDARCVALFASELQRSDAPAPGELAEAIGCTVRRFGIAGCASRMAQEFGDHPDAATSRMRWIRQLVTEAFAPLATRPGAWRLPAGPGWRAPVGAGWRAPAAPLISPAA